MVRTTTPPGPSSRVGRLAAPALALLALVAGCGGDGGATSPPTGPPAAQTSPASSAPPTSGPPTDSTPSPPSTPGGPCAEAGSLPEGAATATVDTTTLPDGGDLLDPADGPETLFLVSGVTRSLGVQTASGAVSAVPVLSAAPEGVTALAANLDGAGPVEVLLDDGRTSWLYAVVDCTLQPVLGPDGQPWAFDRGFRGNGTGVGCTATAADGTRELLGLEAEGSTVASTRIVLDGLTAVPGATTTEQVDAAATRAATQVTCDALTLVDDGLHEPG